MEKSQIDYDRVYGRRARLGLIVPPSNSTNEAEFWERVPADISVVTVRMDLHLPDNGSDFEEIMCRDLDKACRDLKAAGADICIYACTAGSMAMDKERLSAELNRHGLPSLHTAEALLQAFSALRVSKLAIATPYTQPINAHEKHYLEQQGLEVLAIDGLNIGEEISEFALLSQIPSAAVSDHALSTDRREAEALFISCTDLPASTLIAPLEQKLGKPVVTSNQATLWAALRKLGFTDSLDNYGSLWST
ncbi:MAG: maleate cis-trans isomerase family protein [Methyloligellaceae bacterium]